MDYIGFTIKQEVTNPIYNKIFNRIHFSDYSIVTKRTWGNVSTYTPQQVSIVCDDFLLGLT